MKVGVVEKGLVFSGMSILGSQQRGAMAVSARYQSLGRTGMGSL